MLRNILIIIILLITCTGMAGERGENRARVRMVAVGDMMLGRGVANKIIKNSPEWLFEDVAPIFHDADIVFGNLESPLTSNNSLPKNGYAFTGDPAMAGWLSNYGFNVVSVANNHAFDRSVEAVKDTLKYLADNKIASAGGGVEPDEPYQAKIIEINKTKFAFFAAESIAWFDKTPGKSGVAFLDLKLLVPEIKKVRGNVDFVIVSLHWGVEYDTKPTPGQIEIAHKLIDSGVDVILGHHPHVIQGIERYKKGLIVYSLGNFIFDQKDERTKRSMIIAIDFYSHKRWFTNPMMAPIAIREFRPVLDYGPDGNKTIAELKQYGKGLGENGIKEFYLLAPQKAISYPPLPTDILNK